jgi:threonine/homoserine/homoserine lactone efflux protein
MLTDLFIPFLVTAILIELTPGPNMAWLALASATHGKRAGFAAVAGIAAGLVILAAASAAGLAELAARSPLAFGLLRYAGVAYLLWLAWQTWVGEGQGASDDVQYMAAGQWFRHGLLLNLLNPKAAVFFVAVLPGYMRADVSVAAQTTLLSGSYVVIATLVHLAIVMLAAQAHGWLQSGGRAACVRRVFAGLLAAVALWFLLAGG